MNSKGIARLFLFFVFSATVSALPPQAEPSIPVTLRLGVHGIITNGCLMLPQSGRNYAIASSGRYITREGIVLMVENQGQLEAKTVASLRATLSRGQSRERSQDIQRSLTYSEVKRSAPAPSRSTSWGPSHQTGSNL